MRFKSLIIIVLLFVVNLSEGQVEESALDRIDFNDTTMVDSDFMWETIAEYVTKAQNRYATGEKQTYNMILATDDILSRCTNFIMYKAVYQYLIYGFSQLGANPVVDYMMRMPYLENSGADEKQYDEMKAIAEQYERNKIGSQAHDIQSKTIKNIEFTLSEKIAENTIVLFWSYSCPHCREIIKELGKMFAKNKDLTIVTINVSGDLKQVKKLLRKSRLANAYNICDGLGWNSPIVDDYAVDMTPSLFLLDENMIIIAKPFDIEELKTDLGL